MQNMRAAWDTFWEKASLYMDVPKMTRTDIVEIIIITILLYYVLIWIRNTRAWALLKGLLVILVFVGIAALFQMNTIIWIVKNTVSVTIIALVVVFQPEMRRALENLGRKNILTSIFSIEFNKTAEGKFSDKTINELTKACYAMGKVKTGALIVLENEITLTEYERTGIEVDAILTSQLLINIFEKNTPLHDGAIIVRGDRVVAATCYLPLTDSRALSKELGTRHRAALGASEASDCLVIVVSEETGNVSIAMGGKLNRNIDADFLRSRLQLLQKREQEVSKIKSIKRRLTNAKKAREKDH